MNPTKRTISFGMTILNLGPHNGTGLTEVSFCWDSREERRGCHATWKTGKCQGISKSTKPSRNLNILVKIWKSQGISYCDSQKSDFSTNVGSDHFLWRTIYQVSIIQTAGCRVSFRSP
ncbi:hypothetical protein X975_16827, partial [Stegodyphus mimosarum]